MKKISIIFIVSCFLFLLIIPSVNAVQLSSEKKINDYLYNLVESYNALVNLNYQNNQYFNELKNNFLLYHEPGYSFRIICTTAIIGQNDTNCFIFGPAISPDPIIEFDYERDMGYYSPGFGFPGCSGCRFRNVTYIDNFQIRNPQFSISVLLENIKNNTYTDSVDFAKQLYNDDDVNVQIFLKQQEGKPLIYSLQFFAILSAVIIIGYLIYRFLSKEDEAIKIISLLIDGIISFIIFQYLITNIPKGFSIFNWMFSFSPIIIVLMIWYILKKRGFLPSDLLTILTVKCKSLTFVA
jgi:hypothetical protein